MRGLIPGLESPHPLGLAMPALFHDDDFAQRMLSAFDEVLAPIFCTLDNIDAYFDPDLAPDDFVPWLATWVGMALDENWSLARQRELVKRAGDLYSWRGTARGLAAQVAIYTGVEPEIVETGGCTWSAAPGAQAPGSVEPRVTVRIRVTGADAVDEERLERIVASAKPAHVVHEVEVITG